MGMTTSMSLSSLGQGQGMGGGAGMGIGGKPFGSTVPGAGGGMGPGQGPNMGGPPSMGGTAKPAGEENNITLYCIAYCTLLYLISILLLDVSICVLPHRHDFFLLNFFPSFFLFKSLYFFILLFLTSTPYLFLDYLNQNLTDLY